LNDIKTAGKWCPTCAGNRPLTIEEAKQIAISRGGLCLSTKYVNTGTPLEWQCGKCENTWPSPLASIKGGTWCPHCKNKNESATRELLEELTGFKFPLQRGLFARNRRWQLDGYCPSLGLAFEYNGRQHYEYVPMFHKNGIADLEKQKARDAYVAGASLELKTPVYIIVVPYWLTDKARKIFVWKELWFLGVLSAQYDNDTGIPPF
jgi:hypothetical protein